MNHSRFGTTSISYDGTSNRVKKVSPSGTTYYIGEHFEITPSDGYVKYVFAGNLRIAKVSMAGGGISELAGQGFEKGALLAGFVAFARFTYNEITGFDAKWEKGEGYQLKGRLTLPDEGYCHIGEQGKGNDPKGWFNEGGRISRIANYIPGVNATSGMHDVFQVKLDQFFGLQATGEFMRNVLNVPGMIPAAALTYSGLFADPRAMILYSIDPTRDRDR